MRLRNLSNGWVKNLLKKVDGKYVGADASTRN